MFPFYLCGTRREVNVIVDKAPDKIQKTVLAQTIPYFLVNSYQTAAAHTQKTMILNQSQYILRSVYYTVFMLVCVCVIN